MSPMASSDSSFHEKSTLEVNSGDHSEMSLPPGIGDLDTVREALNVRLRNQVAVQNRDHTPSATSSIRSVEEALARIDQAAGVKSSIYSKPRAKSGL